MCMLVAGAEPSDKKEESMQEIKASILDRGKRKFWYIRYQVFFNNSTGKPEEASTKVLKSEKSLEYMQDVYLPAWVERKKEELRTSRDHSIKFEYYSSMYLEDCKSKRDYYNMERRVNRILKDFGSEDIRSIKKLQVKRWINNLPNANTGADLTKASRKKYKSTFNAVFEYALDDEVIDRNFIGEIKVVGADRDRDAIKPFSAEEVRLLLESSKDRKYGELLHLILVWSSIRDSVPARQ